VGGTSVLLGGLVVGLADQRVFVPHPGPFWTWHRRMLGICTSPFADWWDKLDWFIIHGREDVAKVPCIVRADYQMPEAIFNIHLAKKMGLWSGRAVAIAHMSETGKGMAKLMHGC